MNDILPPEKDPLGTMMLDYLAGKRDAEVEVESTTLEMTTMRGEVMFREHRDMDAIERLALARCRGRVLDVGGGSGCHSLWLQQQGFTVDTLDISPGCLEVMRRRGVANPLAGSFFHYRADGYATILMLMNGIGICGSLDGLTTLLHQARVLLEPGGQLLTDSTDLAPLCRGALRRWHGGGYHGETEFVMRYGNIVSAPFPWLYIDFFTMQAIAEHCGFSCERLIAHDDGRYLMRLS